MIVVDVLLALNLVLFVVCAIRAPRPARPSVDDLLAAARSGRRLAVRVVPAHVPQGNVIPFRTREELHLAHARAAHPSGSLLH